LSASVTTVSVARGQSGTVTVTVTRTGSFTGPVSLQPTNMPAGVTALFSAPSVASGSTTSTLTITASASAAPGTTTLTIVGNGAGAAHQTLAIQLTVTGGAQAGPFTMTLSVASYLALPPSNLVAMPTLTIARNPGFTGVVNLSVSGLPVGLVVAATPNAVTGNTARLAIINGGASNGVYQVTIRGTAAGLGEQTITLPITVASPSTGSIQWQFCENAARYPQLFVAVKDGTGPWTRIVPNGVTHAFNATSSQVQLALVTNEAGGYRTTIFQHTAQEMSARAASDCVSYPSPSQRSATVPVTGAVGAEITLANLGYSQSSVNGNVPIPLVNLPAGPLDLVAFRGNVNAQADFVASRVIVRRGLNPAAGASLTALDFTAADAFTPTTSTWTFGNTNGEQFGVSQQFSTAGGTWAIMFALPGIDRTATTRPIIGVPAAQTIAGDLHQVVATVNTNATPVRATRQIITYARTIADRTLNFGSPMSAATVTAVAGAPAGRLRAQGTLPTEYNTGVSLDVSQPSVPQFATIHATRGFLGAGAAYDIQIPDLSGVLGWDSNFALRGGVAATWWVSGGGPALDYFDGRYIFNSTRARWTGAVTGITPPADGATYLIGRVSGTITP
jgi:hypothetical protein